MYILKILSNVIFTDDFCRQKANKKGEKDRNFLMSILRMGYIQGALYYRFFGGAKMTLWRKMQYEIKKKVPVAMVIAKRKNSRHVKFPGISSMFFCRIQFRTGSSINQSYVFRKFSTNLQMRIQNFGFKCPSIAWICWRTILSYYLSNDLKQERFIPYSSRPAQTSTGKWALVDDILQVSQNLLFRGK